MIGAGGPLLHLDLALLVRDIVGTAVGVIAHSFGAGQAIGLAGALPQRVRRLGVIGGPRPPPDGFAAPADPTRCRVVERLGAAPATAGEIAAQLPVSRQAVVKHLAVLEAAGLAAGTRDGRRVVYRLTPGRFAAVRETYSFPYPFDFRL